MRVFAWHGARTSPALDRPNSERVMTTVSEPNDLVAIPAEPRGGPLRFVTAYVFGVLAVLVVAAGAILAFEASYDGRILPGVHVGFVDLSGLTRGQAEGRLVAAYGSLGDGRLTLTAAGHERTVSYADLGRRLDTGALLDRAMASGRTGSPAERVAGHVRTAILGTTIGATATVDPVAAGKAIDALAADVDASPKNATVTATANGFAVTPGTSGGGLDRTHALQALARALAPVDAPKQITIEATVAPIEPDVTTEAATVARDAAVRIAQDIVLVQGSETWTIPAATVRGLISFGPSGGSPFAPIVSLDGLDAVLRDVAAKVAIKPVDAQFLLGKGSSVVGVTAGKPGRVLDVRSTLAALQDLIASRADGGTVSQVTATTTTVEPALSTEAATKTAPLMQPVSEWTTYFPVGVNNGFGANIWIPAADLDGQVVMPGAWFDFWRGIGPISRDRGYKDGGAIINGKTEPTGALAGGICSASTTLFNAALRAGLQMGARMNHYYYINRYPLGLDATVFDSGSGSVQTMSFRNDTPSPILIRSYRWSVGSAGYVKFVLYSVPMNRTVTLSTPIVKNVVPARMTYVETTSLPPGVRNVTDAAIDGKDVWVTRTVTDSSGAVIHKETYYSHYSMIVGITLVGVAPSPTPVTTPAPTTP